ncbi:hypothetical protein FH039_01250 [Thermococcus indicus]|uniref:Uncharacterized protein n=1 Tax=Thermococcus indicus TaxID=2586643 RepID=A0A4Y5SJY4_9EURY|nr:hypothetical protein [Thermococcus indicus]QDA30512.1 hypothetical protein FH039_01250 [Thermococcus indicus]
MGVVRTKKLVKLSLLLCLVSLVSIASVSAWTSKTVIPSSGCWRMYDHDADTPQWSQDEWVWAGVSGWLNICDGRITVDTSTVKHVAYWSGVKVDRSKVQRYTGARVSFTKIPYERYNGDPGEAFALIPHFYKH